MHKFRIYLGFVSMFLLLSCAIPTSHDISELGCVKFKDDFVLARDINTCPTFNNKPQPQTTYWELYQFDEKLKADMVQSKKYQHKVVVKSCDLPTIITEYVEVSHDVPLKINEVITRNDTVRYNRMFIYGSLLGSDGQPKEWVYESLNNEMKSFNDRIFHEFERCDTGT